MRSRNLLGALLAALSDNPVVLLCGARQSGKTTLVKDLLTRHRASRYFTLDDPAVLSSVTSDPAGFLENLDGPVIIDEIQRAPELFIAIKATIDRDRRPGRFLLTGSANVLLLPRLSESLAGRMEVLTLWPFSQGEIEGYRESFIDAVFAPQLRIPAVNIARPTADVLNRALSGGFPEMLRRREPARRRAWFNSYVTTILQRDVRDIVAIEGLTAMPRLLALLAARAGGLQNFAELAVSSGIPQSTLKRYLTLLETTFLVSILRPWSGNLGQRLVKSPKLFIADTGLLSHLLGLDLERLLAEGVLKGPLLENFVAMELCKQQGWSDTRPELYHFRTQSQKEVDIVMESAAGKLVGIEVKSAATVVSADFAGLRVLAAETGKKFHRGIVLYSGNDVLPFGPNFFALPFAALWRTGTRIEVGTTRRREIKLRFD